ncbi:hypothetical protein L1049_000693 [Liquidambar formosana]|uniref:MAPK kinase substrate protein n=1 Tax=Liquidambar formosana TaxID=63359 RepID=A0AAP0NA64_LIQFO
MAAESMSGLQRSVTSFRRQGSSGLVWDDKFLSGELNQIKQNDEQEKEKVEFRELRPSPSVGSNPMMERSRSNGGGHAYRTRKVASPPIDPPSPRVSGCGLCAIFGKPVTPAHQPKSGKRKSY